MPKRNALPLALLLITFHGLNHADYKYRCGVESRNFAGEANSFVMQISADSTTYGTTNELFGTSSSDDCNTQTITSAAFQRSVLVAHNLDNIAQDIAHGSGVYLDSLAALMQMSELDALHFNSVAMMNYDHLFGDPIKGHSLWLERLDSTLEEDARLAKYSLRKTGT